MVCADVCIYECQKNIERHLWLDRVMENQKDRRVDKTV